MADRPDKLDLVLRERFGLSDFRPGQREALDHIVAGEHTLLVMPTGSGKSLCYQLPALLDDGMVLVVSPLIALMQDQVRTLQRLGITVAALHSLQPAEEQALTLRRMAAGLFRLVYVAPERLQSTAFTEALPPTVRLLAVDEAHCISQWGHDFRPAYLGIHRTWEALGQPTILAATATATPQVQQDIVRQLHLPSAERVVTGYNRPNLFFSVAQAEDEDEKLDCLFSALPEEAEGSYIIYVGTKRAAEELADLIGSTTHLQAACYHGGMEGEDRRRVQAQFRQDRINVLVATNAFGMGVDKANVRAVIHWDIPGTLEAYYQEAGRAGRDGQPARCTLIYSPQDRALQEWFINNDAPNAQALERLHQALAEAKGRRGGPLTIDENALRRKARLGDIKLRVGMSLLQAAGMLEEQGRDGASLMFTLSQGASLNAQHIMAEVEERREHKRQLLERMIAYAESDGCRRRSILDYFGDRDGSVIPHCCDNCERARGR